MKTANLLQIALLLICSGIAWSNATKMRSNERRALIEAAIAGVNEEFAQKQAESLNGAEGKLHSFKMSTTQSLAQGNARLRFEKMVRKAEKSILEKQQLASAQTTTERVEALAMEVLHKPGSLLSKQEIARMYQASECHATLTTPPDCSSLMTNERTADGTCNNLQNPTFGAANTKMRRLIPPRYDDGVCRLQGTLQIRGVSIVPGPFSPPNPSPRVVSLGVVMDRPVNDSQFSHILMQWGQFMDHDLDAIPEFEGNCPTDCTVEEDSCVPFPVPEDDEEVSRISGEGMRFCHGFRRSLPACDGDTPEAMMPREQLNSITHFIDGSMVYHHDPDVMMNLIRDPDSMDGMLRVGPPVEGTSRPTLPVLDTVANPHIVACPNPPCFLAGDFRVNEHTSLTMMHTLWVREHNRIAQALRSGNPGMSSNEIFETTRSIVIAEIQKITYKDYLPLLLGDSFSSLVPDYTGYDSSIDPNVPNAFATAAYRFGHSQIQPFFERLNENYESIPAGPLPLVDAFFDTSQFTNNGGVDPILRGLLSKNARLVDEFINSILTNHLFSESLSEPGFDLAALNVQRGRDHGLPPYLTWKQWAKTRCGIESDFRNQLTQIHLLQTYGGLNNVDLFVGGLAEEPLPGGVVGATFACIFANTFSALRDGDRFYYENPAGPMPLFTPAQRAEIEMASLSRVICDNSGITEVQPNAFMANQARVPCSQIPTVDLSQWSSESEPDLCYIKFRTGATGEADYTAISMLLNSGEATRVDTETVSGMSTDCLSFLCPTETFQTRVTAFASNWCPVMTNMNLQDRLQWLSACSRLILKPEDIISENGLYRSLASCQAGSDFSLQFCANGPDVKLAAKYDQTAQKQQMSSEDTKLRELLSNSGLANSDIDLILEDLEGGGNKREKVRGQADVRKQQMGSDAELRNLLTDNGFSNSDINLILEDLEGGGASRKETTNKDLIAAMEQVLAAFKTQSKTEEKADEKKSSVMELEEALKDMN